MPAPKLFPAAGNARWIALRQQALGDGILEAAILGRYEARAAAANIQWQDWIDAQLRKVRGALAALEIEVEAGELARGRRRRADDRPDRHRLRARAISISATTARIGASRWRRLAAWYAAFAERKSMQLTVPQRLHGGSDDDAAEPAHDAPGRRLNTCAGRR